MMTTPHSGTDRPTGDQRLIALGRVQILRAYREEDVPPARTAQGHDLSPCTPGRWDAKDRPLGLIRIRKMICAQPMAAGSAERVSHHLDGADFKYGPYERAPPQTPRW